ncbi:uridine kinase [Salpingoeca rosetta]|uniref:Uridine kinase n=1 Tax=Salpingoeca rosetta (strain ATCC 50818 / BSB-021) TaxID=946362 RepID=F2UFG2_SALR5|nr:uridine kinase [Salpingoeca rosetta]EGD75530.1 uridine kinase [Salpingoeca rosetta]|eukprot:XP_004991987.1 uridine kinase [Salpingoeca rosetta]
MSRTRVRTVSLCSTAGSDEDEKAIAAKPAKRTVFMAGRPPWYDVAGKQQEALVIGICGGSASGKTTVAHQIIQELGVSWVCLLSMDSFYKVLNPEEKAQAARNEFNFDHPNAFDVDLLIDTLGRLKEGKKVNVPVYDFTTHSRLPDEVVMYGANVIIFEGILAFCAAELRELLDVKVFVKEDDDVRLARRLVRDTKERGRDLEGAIKQYTTFVYPAFKQFIEPAARFADVVIPGGVSNSVGMDMLIGYVKKGYQARGFDLKQDIIDLRLTQMPKSFHQMPSSRQLVSLMTSMRDRDTDLDRFVFASERVMKLLIEFALSFVPYDSVQVTMSDGSSVTGKRVTKQLVGVAIVRAGLPLEKVLRDMVRDIAVGQLLIQTNPSSGQPEFFHQSLPKQIHKSTVLLLDASIATGQAAIMAIRVLLDHGVAEENIVLVTLLASKMGVCSVAYAYPKVTIVAANLDTDLDDDLHILPGFGNFGDRFYGTTAIKGTSPK